MKPRASVYTVVVHVVLALVTASMVLPVVLLFMSSITADATLVADGYSFFPRELSLDAYVYLFQNASTILRAYGITILVTAVGTALGLFLTSTLAYALSLPELPGRRVIGFLVFFTLLFNGGLVPAYIMWSELGVRNTLLAYIVPTLLVNAFNVILMRTFYEVNIPREVYEAAKMDGAGYVRTYLKIVLPLGKPIMVTIGLFIGLMYWNDWMNGLYYVNDSNLFSIQTYLNKIIQDVQAVSSNSAGSTGSTAQLPQVSIRMAVAFVALLPLLVIYPMLQKYFAKGIMLGAVKG
ncbi:MULTISPECIES: carbohydrate ABC transporter permease [Cellulomonas]|jgi:putative aldouronate transport system permease protein|uniref:carbohydrate ABC transporter permease n=1 Tax=Cellulomonas TaxID=1707 RepID=UPI0006255C9F|nr:MULTISPECIES: carbohydrate ABC transporter permease [Cellulomonas]UCN13691.1 carbohydrate ABC transporter permease [Cellulomonas iranensis]